MTGVDDAPAQGRLYLVGTPIGNLNDLSPRALQVLREVDTILCEDTRHTGKLLDHFGIRTRTDSLHEHNEESQTERYLRELTGGRKLALVSDAGLPLLSDPGYRLVKRSREQRIPVEPIPGPFAAALALIASGLPPLPFTFVGFTPHRRGERLDFYRHIAQMGHTVVAYESPQRLIESLDDGLSALGDIEITVAREMTKLHEEFLHGSISSVIEKLRLREIVRGEVTLVFSAAEKLQPAVSPSVIREEFEKLRAGGMRRNDATRLLAEKFGLRKSDLYRLLLD